ncbi:hypothetical protein FBQ97_21855 [Acidobacteria bacterium ACD]|nr:MAG: hypothetical protein EDX89_17125 [Acidobacteriota bacterium]MCE7959725.1 hypothetical protein [Acidobacteria bacterium ACB2]MDL1952431.1 hypothetical protein [Acidobacteria bacterium ACD]
MARFPKGKWSFLGAVYLCPIARLEWDGTTCKVSPWAHFFTGASVMSPYSAGDAVAATKTSVYTSSGSLYLSGSFDFSSLKGMKGSFVAEVFSDYSLALLVKYSYTGQKETSATWYGTVDTSSIEPAWDAAGRSFLVQYMSGDVAGGVVGASVGALKVVDVGAGWTFGYGMAAAKAGAGAGVSLPAWSDWCAAEVPGTSAFPDWSDKPFLLVERGTAPYGYNQSLLQVILSGSVSLSLTWQGWSTSLGLEVKAAWGGGGKLGPRFVAEPYLCGVQQTNPITVKY